MDIELITNEVIRRLLDNIKQEEQKSNAEVGIKFLQTSGDIISIPGYLGTCLDGIKNSKDLIDFEFLVINELTIEELACAVHGMTINDKTSILSRFLLSGKNVFVIEEGLEHRLYKEISNPNYYKIFREYERQLVQFGIRVLSLVALERVLQNESGQKNKVECNRLELADKRQQEIPGTVCVYSTEKKLITNDMAIQLAKGASVVLKLGTIITPSAKDVFRENNTTISFI